MTMHLGTVPPGSTLPIPFHTFDSNDPSASVTITGLAVTDIEIYKDGAVTQRASDTGYTLLDTDGIDFDGLTGIHGFSIDLASNATANFFEAGSFYWVVVSAITVDAATVSFVAATFRIGYPGAILDSTIATLASQTSFTLEDGSADNDAYNGCVAVVHDLASAVQVAQGVVLDYVGSTKTVTLAFDPAVFTMAAGDNISIFPRVNAHAWNGVPLATTNPLPNAAADAAGGLPISDAGGLDLDGMDTSVAAILVDTAEIGAAGAGLTALATQASVNTIDGIVDDILLDTAEIGAAGAGLTAVGVATLAVSALADLFNTDSGDTYAGAVAGSVVKEIADNAGGSSLTEAGIADAVWDELQSGHVGAGSFGEIATEIASILVDTAEIANLNDLSAAEVNAEVDTALTDYDGPTHAELVSEINDVQTDIAALNDPTAAAIADAVWDEDATGHQTGGTFGQAIGDPGANTETMYDAVVTDAAGTNVAADIIAVKAETAAIVNDTDLIDDATSGLAKIATDVAAVLVDTGTTLDGKINTIDGIVDDILVDTAEIGAAGAGLTEAGGDGDHLTAVPDTSGTTTLLARATESRLAELDAAGLPTDIAAVENDTQDMQARLPAALTAGGNIKADTLALDGNTTAAGRLAEAGETIFEGAAATGTLSTTQATTDLTLSANDQLNGRLLTFKRDTATAALRGQQTQITDSAVTGGLLTFVGLTTAPADGDTFVIQ
jgi:hypothetical protein